MQAKDRQDWQQANEIFDDLLDLPQAAWHQSLAQIETNEHVKAKVRALFEHVRTDGLLGSDAAAVDVSSLPLPSLAGRTIGGWVLGEIIGRGGMATVFRAERIDADFQQTAALKLLNIGTLAFGGAERFARERQLLARLRHPSIAQLIDGGVAADGTPFLVTELVEGITIAQWVQNRQAATRAIVQMVLDVADAVALAHRHLVVHRDIKPSNVLVDAHGQPKLLDFGIAKLIDEPHTDTNQSTRIFTPEFAAPEQAAGGEITTATDVYGLGRLLATLLVLANDGSKRDVDLAAIVDMATRDLPSERYRDAQALADELRLWQQGLPVAAGAGRSLYQLRKFVARKRSSIAVVSILLVVIIAGSLSTLWQAAEARRERDAAQDGLAFMLESFRQIDPFVSQSGTVQPDALLDAAANGLIDRFADHPEIRSELHRMLAEMYISVSSVQAAARDRQKVFKQLELALDSAVSPGQHSAAHHLLAKAHYTMRDFAIAAQHIDQAVALAQTDSQTFYAYVGKAYIALANRNYERADNYISVAEQFEQGARLSPSRRFDLFDLKLLVLMQQERWEQARQVAKQALSHAVTRSFPAQHASLLERACDIEVALQDYATAANYADQAVELLTASFGPDHPMLIGPLSKLAQAKMSLQDFDSAKASAERAALIAQQQDQPDEADLDVIRNIMALLE